MLVYIMAVILCSVGAFNYAASGNGWMYALAGVVNLLVALYGMWKRTETIK